MSREIKFRFWDAKESRWLGKDSSYWKELTFEDCRNKLIASMRQGNIVAEQYTGLKDKNGKDVYEGDVVKMARSYGYRSLPKGALVKVVYDEEELCYKLKGRGEFRLTANKAVEVVGNIHESNMEEE